MVISNDGTVELPDDDIKVFVNNKDESENFDFGTISPHITSAAKYGTYTSGTYTIIVVSPSNSIRQIVYCWKNYTFLTTPGFGSKQSPSDNNSPIACSNILSGSFDSFNNILISTPFPSSNLSILSNNNGL